MRALAVAIAMWSLAGCPAPASVEPQPPLGCGKDTDCKGERICVEQRCVFPAQGSPPPVASPTPAAPSATSSPTPPAPSATLASPAPPAPSGSGEVSSGQRPDPRCGCAPGDLMCAMKCAQRGNAAGPSTFPSDEQPKPEAACNCTRADLMCQMRCSKERERR